MTPQSSAILSDTILLAKIWDEFCHNPDATYAEFCNNPLACAMYNKHNSTAISYNRAFCHSYTNFNFPPSITTEKPKYVGTTQVARSSHTLIGNTKSPWVQAQETFTFKNETDSINSKRRTILDNFKTSIDEILTSMHYKNLLKIANSHALSYALHARTLGSVLEKVLNNPSVKSSAAKHPHILARLNMFLAMLVTLHNKNHSIFCKIMESVIHELSLLILIIPTPLISYNDFKKSLQDEFKSKYLGLYPDSSTPNPNIRVTGYLANTGMYAFITALYLTTQITHQQQGVKYYIDPNIYYECMTGSPAYKTLEQEGIQRTKQSNNATIFIINASDMAGFTDTTINATNINDFVAKLQKLSILAKNKHIIIVADTTITKDNKLVLDENVKNLVSTGLLSIIFFQSLQKFGILGMDCVQGGQVIVVSNNKQITDLDELNQQLADKDMRIIDMQMCALFQSANCQYNYLKSHYRNADILNKNLYHTESSHNAPCLRMPSNLQKLSQYFDSIGITKRTSFGFNQTTFSITYSDLKILSIRLQAGSEAEIDAHVLACTLSKLNQISSKYPQSDSLIKKEIMEQIDCYFRSPPIDQINSRETAIDFVANLYLANIVLDHCNYATHIDLIKNIYSLCKNILQNTPTSLADISNHIGKSNSWLSFVRILRIKATIIYRYSECKNKLNTRKSILKKNVIDKQLIYADVINIIHTNNVTSLENPHLDSLPSPTTIHGKIAILTTIAIIQESINSEAISEYCLHHHKRHELIKDTITILFNNLAPPFARSASTYLSHMNLIDLCTLRLLEHDMLRSNLEKLACHKYAPWGFKVSLSGINYTNHLEDLITYVTNFKLQSPQL